MARPGLRRSGGFEFESGGSSANGTDFQVEECPGSKRLEHSESMSSCEYTI